MQLNNPPEWVLPIPINGSYVTARGAFANVCDEYKSLDDCYKNECEVL
jgi:hypothetical protein